MATQFEINPGPVEFSIYGPMVSASGDAAREKYRMLSGKDGRRWVVADSEAPAENIYVDGGPGSEGMGGRTLTFELTDGGTVDLIGPWKTGAKGLFEATGYDVRDKYLNCGIIAFARESGKGFYSPDIYREVVRLDAEPLLAAFDFHEELAQQVADETGRDVWMRFRPATDDDRAEGYDARKAEGK